MTVPTLLANHSLEVHVVQFARPHPAPWHKEPVYGTVMFVHGQPVGLVDLPTRNGAMHVIHRLLNPVKHAGKPHHPPKGGEPQPPPPPSMGPLEEDDASEWAGWEEWLPRWAAEN